MPDHDGRPPRALERADASAPARKRASRDAERAESQDEASDEPACSPTWSLVSLCELTSRASSPCDVSSSSVVGAAAGELFAREVEEAQALFSNGPPGRKVESKKATSDTAVASSVEKAPFERESFEAAFAAPPSPSKETPRGSVPSAADDFLARRLITRLRAATASRLHALARTFEADDAEEETRAGGDKDSSRGSDVFRASRRALEEALESLERFSRRALAALGAAARHGGLAVCHVVTDARERFSALANAFEDRFTGRPEVWALRTFPDARGETKRKKKNNVFRSARDLPWLAAAAALAPLAPAVLWIAFSSACPKRT